MEDRVSRFRELGYQFGYKIGLFLGIVCSPKTIGWLEKQATRIIVSHRRA